MNTPETFWTLLHNAAHWEFEAFLMLVFDVIIAGLFWPFVAKHWRHHLERDRETGLEPTPAVIGSYHTYMATIWVPGVRYPKARADALAYARSLADFGLPEYKELLKLAQDQPYDEGHMYTVTP